MPKYVIPYSIDGEIEIEAETSTEAELKFMQMGKREIAEAGALVTYETESIEQFRARRAKRRNDLPNDVEAHR